MAARSESANLSAGSPAGLLTSRRPAATSGLERIEPADAELVLAALARLPELGPLDRIDPVEGGLSNRTYRVTAAGGTVAVRVTAAPGELLAVDRTGECSDAGAAAARGAAPALLLCDPLAGVTVSAWVAARTLDAADLDDADMLARVAAACRRLHDGPAFRREFDMFTLVPRYRALLADRGVALPRGYANYQRVLPMIERALAAVAMPARPCHNDLLPANLLDDGRRLWLIDFEYGGNNDPDFELGNIWSEAALAPPRLEELVAAYYGGPSPGHVARARLWGLLSKFGWTLWGVIQQAVSPVEFDFLAWAMEKYDRATAELDSADLARWLSDAQIPDQPVPDPTREKTA